MRTVQFLKDFADFKSGDHVEVDDQVACDAIAGGFAVPSVYALEKSEVFDAPATEEGAAEPAAAEPAAEQAAFEPATENRAIEAAPEVK